MDVLRLFNLLVQRLNELLPGMNKTITRPDKYSIIVKSLSKKGDKEEECFTISVQSHDTLSIDFLSKCGDASGNDNVRLIIQTALGVGYRRIELTDVSTIIKKFPNGEEILISNKKLNILTTGNTWYGKHGFVNDNMTENHGKIMEFINLTTHQLLTILEDDKKMKIKQSLTKFNEFNGLDANDETMTIKEIISLIQTQFKGPVLDDDYEKFVFYVKFTQNVYRELLSNLGLLSDPFVDFVLMNPNPDPNLTAKIGGGRKKQRTMRKKRKSGKKRKSRRNKTRYSRNKAV